ncbi:MAG: tRNA threonylcarbamoyladenosine dehydratase [Clostridiales Family XIII bacterium]|jgi:tRNA A37 threonylcarbamoyladenosine dehydratase|nr:tRNA threonylcarbamoyladenosine dehydratase [Clostridiales Family XIII bacterium]
MLDQFSRTTLQLGRENMDRIYAAKTAVFGVGGVGGYCVEALARTGVGAIDLFDDDRICLTNLNRQIIATRKTVGRYKVDVMKERILEINPEAEVGANRIFYGTDTADGIDLSRYDYVIDAVDTMTAKLELVCRSESFGVPVISSMGAANKLDAAAFEVADIYKTSMCPMARIMRKELRIRGIKSLKVVYSKEPAMRPLDDMAASCRNHCICPPDTARTCLQRRQVPASNAFVPAVAGLIMAGEVIRDLIGEIPAEQGGRPGSAGKTERGQQ